MPASSPRLRRPQRSAKVLQQLQSESSILHFTAHGDLPEAYTIWFIGRGMMRQESNGPIELQERHEVHIRLERRLSADDAGDSLEEPDLPSEYFRQRLRLPRRLWHVLGAEPDAGRTVPHVVGHDSLRKLRRNESVQPRSRPWAKTQSQYVLPLDVRSPRHRLAGITAVEDNKPKSNSREKSVVREPPANGRWGYSPTRRPRVRRCERRQPRAAAVRPVPDDGGVIFLDAEVVQAEVVRPAAGDADIMFIQ